MTTKDSVADLAVSLSKISIPKELQKKELQKKELQKKELSKKPETKQEMAIRLLRTNLDKNGLTDWHTKISRAVKRLGSCHYSKKTISLSAQFIEMGTEATILNTILHEVAHALCPGDGHGAKWKKKAIELGCDGKRCAEGFKLKLQFNFECEKGCYASYARKCKTSDYLATGKAKCKKHGLYFYSVNNTNETDEVIDVDDEAEADEIEQKTEASKKSDVVAEVKKEQNPKLDEPIRIYSKYNYECKNGCFESYARKCKSSVFLATGTAKCKKHGLIFTVAVEPNVKNLVSLDDEIIIE
jgi:hypothetical protein